MQWAMTALMTVTGVGIMDISRKLGILVFFGVPAIVGGGILYGLTHGYAAVAVYEICLIVFAGGLISK